MAYGNFKDLKRRTFSHKVLRDKAFIFAENPKYDWYQRRLISMVYKFFGKKSACSSVDEQLAEELHKPIIWNFKKKKVHSGFKYNIWCADLTNVQLISRFNKGFKFLWCVINVFSKYAWIVPLKDKKGITITNAFKIKLEESNRKPNKIWVGKVSEFYNNSFLKMV